MKYNQTAYILKYDLKNTYSSEEVNCKIIEMKINDELIKMFINKKDETFCLNDFYSGLLIGRYGKLKELYNALENNDFLQKIYNARLSNSYYEKIEILDSLVAA